MLKLTTERHETSRGLSATAELLVKLWSQVRHDYNTRRLYEEATISLRVSFDKMAVNINFTNQTISISKHFGQNIVLYTYKAV